MNFRSPFALLSCALLLMLAVGCSPQNKVAIDGKSESNEGKQDCLASAGYVWSQLRKECIRLFEEGVVLERTDPNKDSPLVTYLIAGKDENVIEVFTPEKPEGVMLQKKNTMWSSTDNLILVTQNKAGDYELRDAAGAVLFKQATP